MICEKSVEVSFYIFQKNFESLEKWLEHLKEPETVLIRYSSSQRENLESLLNETSRLFFNFLTSARSLIEHIDKLFESQAFVRHEVKALYQKAVESLEEKELFDFIKRLRDYTLDYTIPILSLEIRCVDTIQLNVVVDVETLKQWKHWRKAKEYLNKCEKDFCVVDISGNYFSAIKDFYSDVFKLIEK